MENGNWPRMVVAALCLTAASLVGCSSTYYQLYQTAPLPQKQPQSDVSITYDFWSEGGRMAFIVRNNTDKIITIHTDKCFFVQNGMSNCHFTGEMVSESSGRLSSFTPYSEISVGAIHTRTSVIIQQRTISIAPRSSHAFNAFVIQQEPIDVAGAQFKPKRGKPSQASYREEMSPIHFSNVLTYSLDGEDVKKTVVDDFFVESITNYHAKDFLVLERKYSFTLAGSGYRAVLANPGRFYNTYIH